MIALFCLGLLFLLPGHSPGPNRSAGQQRGSAEGHHPAEYSRSASFSSAQADFTWDQYQAVVEEHDIQTGTIYYERKKGVTRTAAYIKQDNGNPRLRRWSTTTAKSNYYVPNIKQLTIMRAGANRAQWESFLTLGFGGSGTDLEANWKVSLLGTENMNGVSVAKLDLVPLQQKVLDMFPHVTIWIDPNRGHQLQADLLRAWRRQADGHLQEHSLQPTHRQRYFRNQAAARHQPRSQIVFPGSRSQRARATAASTITSGKHSRV